MRVSYILLLSLSVCWIYSSSHAQTEMTPVGENALGVSAAMAFSSQGQSIGAAGELTVNGRVGIGLSIAHLDTERGPGVRLVEYGVLVCPYKPGRGSGKLAYKIEAGRRDESISGNSVGFWKLGAGLFWDVRAGYRTYVYPQASVTRYVHSSDRYKDVILNIWGISLPILFHQPKGGVVASASLSYADEIKVTSVGFTIGYRWTVDRTRDEL